MQIGSLTWDEAGKHYYYTGTDAVALYVWNNSINISKEISGESTVVQAGWYGAPVAWNGVTAINESPSGAESNKQYADNIEYLNLLSKEEFGLTLECFQVPEEFGSCDGIVSISAYGGHFKVHGQGRVSFGLVYRVLKGSDTVEAGGKMSNTSGTADSYIYHVVYGCKASPSSRDNATVNDSPEAQSLSYEITTSPIVNTQLFPENGGFSEIMHLEIDTARLTSDTPGTTGARTAKEKQTALETVLFGNGLGRMPTPEEIATAIAPATNS